MKEIIKFEDICCAYEENIVLKHVNFSIEEGKCVLLAGDNGCGKSTIFKLMNGLIFPNQGTYYFDGEVITEAKMKDHKFSKKLHQRVGFLWQNPEVQLFCNSLREDIEFGPRQMNLSEEEITQRTDDALKLLKIEHLASRSPYKLSGGEKKRGAIASILTMNPEVWIMDEPYAALDKKGQMWLTEFIKSLKAAGKTIILSSHEENLLSDIIDKVISL